MAIPREPRPAIGLGIGGGGLTPPPFSLAELLLLTDATWKDGADAAFTPWDADAIVAPVVGAGGTGLALVNE